LKNLKLSKRYGQALADGLETLEEVTAVRDELGMLLDLMRKDSGLHAGLSTQILDMKRREDLLGTLGGEAGWSRQTTRFLQVLSASGRMDLLETIWKHLEAWWLDSRGVARLTVASAVPLLDAEVKDLTTTLEKALARPVALDRTVDPSLLGGFKLIMGSTSFDYSIRGNLTRLKARLLEEDGCK